MTEQASSDSTPALPAKAMSNGIPPRFDLPIPDRADTITDNVLKLAEATPNPRLRFIFQTLIKHLHGFVNETDLTTEEWMTAIQFLTRVGQTHTSSRPEMNTLSSVLGVSALVDALNNPVEGNATESTLLGPFYTDDTAHIANGEGIASEGKGEYMYVEGQVVTTEGVPIPGAIIDAWESDSDGFYDMQFSNRSHPDCRGRLQCANDGSFGFRAVVPAPYPIPGDGPVSELLLAMNRHNMRPSHLHIMVEAPGYRKLVTAFFPEGCKYIQSDSVFGIKKSLIVKLEHIDDEGETRKRGFPTGASFKLMRLRIVMLTNEQFKSYRAKNAESKRTA
ncbi:aromatic compound dioxygenase [Pisolithus orientalis]|uniref:aromatic compound dioxygenase n=1 Tax=Pisolithus orientalis TaxID=936130 RepID=UPI002224E7B3|nr:aromatic compound dioxygenase [Pisolithus orientalis]KAI6019850.1 aromatic compound dioxygenase [Pisolithus orientalis]